MDLTLYRNRSQDNALTKTLTTISTFTNVALNATANDDTIALRLAVATDLVKWSNVNYFQFDGAYYFLTSVDKELNGFSVINGEMDLLMTYRAQILLGTAYIDRSTSHGDPYILDDEAKVSEQVTISRTLFPTQLDMNNNGVFVITTSQQGYTVF